MMEKIDVFKSGLNNKKYQEVLYSKAYDVFVKYLDDHKINCFEHIDDDNTITSIGRIVSFPNHQTCSDIIYFYLYEQKEKDIIKLFSEMVNINLYELNYARSAKHFLNKLYNNEIHLGKTFVSDIEITFDKNYIKIVFVDNNFKLFINKNIIGIKDRLHNTEFDINNINEIEKSINQHVTKVLESLRCSIKSLIVNDNNINSKFICSRLNQSLANIYNVQSFNGFKIECLEQFSISNRLSNSVQYGSLKTQSYETDIYPECISLINGYFYKSWSKKLNQLLNLFHFMQTIENKKFSFKMIIRGNSKYKNKFNDPLLLIFNYDNKDIEIDFNHSNYSFICHDFHNVNEEHETVKDNDLNTIYMKTLERFQQRILKTCEVDDININANLLNLYKMIIFNT